MDMSFSLMPTGKPAFEAVSMADIMAATDHRRNEAFCAIGDAAVHLRGQEEGSNRVHALAQLAVSGTCGPIEVALLAGCFNPLVARPSLVGETR
jgi:hypothetical protein